jgi:hypothetical protein
MCQTPRLNSTSDRWPNSLPCVKKLSVVHKFNTTF